MFLFVVIFIIVIIFLSVIILKGEERQHHHPQDGLKRESSTVKEQRGLKKGTSFENEVDASRIWPTDQACVFLAVSRKSNRKLSRNHNIFKSGGEKAAPRKRRSMGKQHRHKGERAEEDESRPTTPCFALPCLEKSEGGEGSTTQRELRPSSCGLMLLSPIPSSSLWAVLLSRFLRSGAGFPLLFLGGGALLPLPFRVVPLFPVIVSLSPFRWCCLLSSSVGMVVLLLPPLEKTRTNKKHTKNETNKNKRTNQQPTHKNKNNLELRNVYMCRYNDGDNKRVLKGVRFQSF